MACNGCGETPAMTKEQVENVVRSENNKLPYLKGVATDRALVATLPDGSTAELPKVDQVLTKDSFDETIEKDANKPDKFGVRLAPNKGLYRTIDGLAVKVGDGLTINKAGEIVLEADLSAIKREMDELRNLIASLPKHHADVLLVDGTGDVDLSYTHASQEM